MEVLLSQTALLKRGLLLEYLTLGWNVVGVIIVILAAFAARYLTIDLHLPHWNTCHHITRWYSLDCGHIHCHAAARLWQTNGRTTVEE